MRLLIKLITSLIFIVFYSQAQAYCAKNLSVYGNSTNNLSCQCPKNKYMNFNLSSSNKYFAKCSDIENFTAPSNLVFWVDSLDIQATNFNLHLTANQDLQTWLDKSGNNINLSQSNSSNRPLFTHTQYNSHYANPLINFNGTSHYMETSTNSNLNFYTNATLKGASIFIVFSTNKTNSTIFDTRVNNATTEYIRILVSNPDITFTAGTINYTTGFGLTNNTLYLLSFIAPVGSPATLWLNGNSIGNTGTNFNISSINHLIRLGASYDSSYSNYLGGNIAEVMVFNRDLTTNQQKFVENYLTNKWNLK